MFLTLLFFSKERMQRAWAFYWERESFMPKNKQEKIDIKVLSGDTINKFTVTISFFLPCTKCFFPDSDPDCW